MDYFTEKSKPKIYFFGCRNDGPGHFWAGVPSELRGYMLAPKDVPKIIAGQIDGGFMPLAEREYFGATTLTHLNDFTILDIVDRSVDTRPGSHAAFVIFSPRLCFEAAFEAARLAFPDFFRRLPEGLKFVNEPLRLYTGH